MAKSASNVVETEDGWETVVEPYGETFPFTESGSTLIGTFVSKREVEQDDLNRPGEKRMANVYEIADADGKKWSVWGSYAIDEGFKDVAEGELVRIIYHDTIKIQNGAQEVKQFTVQKRSA